MLTPHSWLQCLISTPPGAWAEAPSLSHQGLISCYHIPLLLSALILSMAQQQLPFLNPLTLLPLHQASWPLLPDHLSGSLCPTPCPGPAPSVRVSFHMPSRGPPSPQALSSALTVFILTCRPKTQLLSLACRSSVAPTTASFPLGVSQASVPSGTSHLLPRKLLFLSFSLPLLVATAFTQTLKQETREPS